MIRKFRYHYIEYPEDSLVNRDTDVMLKVKAVKETRLHKSTNSGVLLVKEMAIMLPPVVIFICNAYCNYVQFSFTTRVVHSNFCCVVIGGCAWVVLVSATVAETRVVCAVGAKNYYQNYNCRHSNHTPNSFSEYEGDG